MASFQKGLVSFEEKSKELFEFIDLCFYGTGGSGFCEEDPKISD
jgi:hypothetical protein